MAEVPEAMRESTQKEKDCSLLCRYVDSFAKSTAYIMKDHPRSVEYCDQFGAWVKDMLKEYILKGISPKDNAPTRKEAMESVSADLILSKPQIEKPK